MTKDGKPGGTEGVSMKRKGNEDKIAKYEELQRKYNEAETEAANGRGATLVL